jgi:hypothetical protein
MSKAMPGFWEAPPKPEVDLGLGMSDSLSRIQANTSPAGVELAARKAAAFGMRFGDSGVFGDIQPRQAAYQPLPMAQQSTPQPQVNFDMIRDDYSYRVASQLYSQGNCNDSLEGRNGTVYELYENELAILKITAGRTAEHVDIELFENTSDLYDTWDHLMRTN